MTITCTIKINIVLLSNHKYDWLRLKPAIRYCSTGSEETPCQAFHCQPSSFKGVHTLFFICKVLFPPPPPPPHTHTHTHTPFPCPPSSPLFCSNSELASCQLIDNSSSLVNAALSVLLLRRFVGKLFNVFLFVT